MAHANIVQAEFFHVLGDGISLESIEAECRERTFDNLVLKLHGAEVTSGIKTVVRFWDVTGEFTKLVHSATALEEEKGTLLERFSQGERGWSLRWRERRLYARSDSLRAIRQKLIAKHLPVALRSGQVAMERWDHSFRSMHKDEAHEVWERVRDLEHSWLYVFRPNDLLADTNVLVGSFA